MVIRLLEGYVPDYIRKITVWGYWYVPMLYSQIKLYIIIKLISVYLMERGGWLVSNLRQARKNP